MVGDVPLVALEAMIIRALRVSTGEVSVLPQCQRADFGWMIHVHSIGAASHHYRL